MAGFATVHRHRTELSALDAVARFDPPFRLAFVRPTPTTAVIEVVGGVDLTTAPRLADFLDDHLTPAISAVVIDLSAVTFLGSAGLAVLVQQLCRAKVAGRRLRLVTGTRGVDRALRVTGLDREFTRHDNLGAALTAAAEDTAT